MKVFRTEDNKVSKYVHDDGSETTIKTVSSCDNEIDPNTGKVKPVAVNRNKYSVFVSASSGCPVGCKFCHLTIKKFPYKKLSPEQIVENFQEAMKEEVLFKPEIRKMYMKLSWMGMGDAFLLDPVDLRYSTKNMVDWALSGAGVAFGLDGVDISTVLPNKCYGWPHNISKLNDYLLRRYRRNSNNSKRSAVRLFYSLHSIRNREKLIPIKGAKATNSIYDVYQDLDVLSEFRKWYGIDVILHYMFLKDFNDVRVNKHGVVYDAPELNLLKHIIKDYFDNDIEVRILRFYECEESNYKEIDNFDEALSIYTKVLPRIKYQVSAGSEINAACGQFLCLTNN